MKELSALNDEQREVLQALREKGCISVTKRKFMVVLSPEVMRTNPQVRIDANR